MIMIKVLIKIFSDFYEHVLRYKCDYTSAYHKFISHNRDIYHVYKRHRKIFGHE
jgi:hypothetical protein